MIDKKIKKVFEENSWFIATGDEELNVVPVGFKMITDDESFAVGAVFLDTTLKNIEKNNKIAIGVLSANAPEAYQIKGSAKIVNDGDVFDSLSNIAQEASNGQLSIKCAIIVKTDKLVINSPNEDNNKEIYL